MVRLCEKSRCTGCEACVNICPVHCIKRKVDERGFLIPSIHHEECIGCGKCTSVCPVLNPVALNSPRQVLAACAKKEEERSRSASGGIAGVLYKRIIQLGGVAYGVVLNKEYQAVFVRTETEDKIEEYRGSKYVGSLMGEIYLSVQKDLKEKRKVLFVGMSCQIAGLLCFLGQKYDELITVDILCHGMPSHLYFKEYIEECERERQQRIEKISFRDNNRFRLRCQFSDSIYECRAKYDRYFAGYTSMLFYRDSCYSCPYARVERNSDITLGDFWGYGNEKRMAPTNLGVSMVLLNTEKGTSFFESISREIKVAGSTIERAVSVNSQLSMPSPIHERRKDFMDLYVNEGFEKASREVIGEIVRRNKAEAAVSKIKKYVLFPYRGTRWIRRKGARLVEKKNVGKWVRNHWRNQQERKRLNNKDFTIISNTCIGGIICHDMGLMFSSPTVNLYIRPKDFVEFVSRLEYYLSLELVEIIHPAPYPVAKLGELTLYLKHYASFEAAKEKWEERKRRINYDNIYIMMTDRDFIPPKKGTNSCGRAVLEMFDRLPYKKVCFTAEEYEDLKSCKVVEKNKDGDCVNIITDITDYSGRRLYQYAREFDYIEWLNE